MDEEKDRRSRIPVPKIHRSASFAYGPRAHSSPRGAGEKRGPVTQQRASTSAVPSGNISYIPSQSANASPLVPRKMMEFGDRNAEDHEDAVSICSSTHSHSWKSSRLKYAVHCQGHHDQVEEYLTPTQRANRTIRSLRAALQEAQDEIRRKDNEIQHLTRELVELRLFRMASPPDTLVASDSSPEDTSKPPEVAGSKSLHSFETPVHSGYARSVSVPSRFDDLQPPSLTDSGHYDDLTSPNCRSKESLCPSILVGIAEESGERLDLRVGAGNGYDWRKDSADGFDWRKRSCVADAALSTDYCDWDLDMMKEMESQLEQMKRRQVDEIHDLKEKYNNKLEQALQQLTEANSRYCYILPEVEATRLRLRSAESEIDQLRHELSSKETRVFDLTKKLNEVERLLLNSSVAESGQLERIISEKEMELDNCRREIIQFKKDDAAKDLRIKSLEQEVASLKQELLHKGNEISNLTSKMEGLQRVEDAEKVDISRADLEGQLRASVIQLERLKAERPSVVSSHPDRDPEMTLKFLRSAVFYLLTDRENHAGHLKAIQSILEFSPLERAAVDKTTKYWFV